MAKKSLLSLRIEEKPLRYSKRPWKDICEYATGRENRDACSFAQDRTIFFEGNGDVGPCVGGNCNCLQRNYEKDKEIRPFFDNQSFVTISRRERGY